MRKQKTYAGMSKGRFAYKLFIMDEDFSFNCRLILN